MTYSERELEFTFAKNDEELTASCTQTGTVAGAEVGLPDDIIAHVNTQ